MRDLKLRLRDIGHSGCSPYLACHDALDRIEALEAEVAGLREAHGEQERYLHEAEGLRTRLSTMTEDRDKWAAESAENLRSLAIMTANAEALANELLVHEEYRWMSSWANGPFKSSPALASHKKLMEGSDAEI